MSANVKIPGRAVVAGHICLDVTPVFPPEASLSSIRPGGITNVGPAEINAGGAVANTGLALRFFGADVRLMGKVGADPFGELVQAALERHGGASGLIVDPGCETSYSIVIAPPGTDRIFLHDPGANESFTASDVDERELEEAQWFHFGYPPIMRGMYLNGGAELERVFRRAKSAGCVTSLDMAAIDPSSEAGRQDWREILRAVLPYVDFFVPSLEELCYMVRRDMLGEVTAAIGSDRLSISGHVLPVADAVSDLGCRSLIIKCGAAGFYCRTGSRETLSGVEEALGRDVSDLAGRSRFERSYVPAKVVSGTGAGDTTIAAFIASMLSGYSFDDCLHLAAATGANCVEAIDALGALLPLDKQFERITSGLQKQELILN